jgi:hypothetical protein
MSVASAGDVNGDGFDDLVVGAACQDNGATDEGNTFVYLGSAVGVPLVPSISLDNPANQAGGHFGNSVASAGDVNGDGFADLVVGAPYQDCPALNGGDAFVYLGSVGGVPSSPSVTVTCGGGDDRLGGSVAWAGERGRDRGPRLVGLRREMACLPRRRLAASG